MLWEVRDLNNMPSEITFSNKFHLIEAFWEREIVRNAAEKEKINVKNEMPNVTRTVYNNINR